MYVAGLSDILLFLYAEAMPRLFAFKWFFKEEEPPPPPDPHAYAVEVQCDEAALGRFVKRLSVSGAENIRVERTETQVIRVKMTRPVAAKDWEATVDALVDRCRLCRMIPAPPARTSNRLRRFLRQQGRQVGD